MAICSQCLLKNHRQHNPILSEEEYNERSKLYAISHEEITHISTEIRKIMISNVEILDIIEENGQEQIKKQEEQIELLK
jgi:hypothetical protein